MTLSEMRQVLAARGLRLTKSLGQNFLHDGNQLRRIVAAAEVTVTDLVLEIGPGLGPLTELLLERAGEVLAIEKDERLVQVLRERFGEAPFCRGNSPPATMAAGGRAALRLIHGDGLEYLRRNPMDWSGWKLVANLPYSVASPILVELARGERSPRRMVATLQLEVARRLMAGPGDKDYGILTLLVQIDFEPVGWFKIPARCFFPEPDVDSACICLRRRPRPWLATEARKTFVRIVKRAFSERRKMMLKLLKQDWPKEALDAAFAELEIPPQQRAERLGLEQYVDLARKLGGHG